MHLSFRSAYFINYNQPAYTCHAMPLIMNASQRHDGPSSNWESYVCGGWLRSCTSCGCVACSLSLSLSLVVVVRVYCCSLPSGMQLPLARTSRYSTYVRILLVQPACHCRCCVVRDMSTRYVYTYYPCTCMVHAGPVRAVRVHGTTRRDHRACTRPFIGMHGRRI